MTEEAMLTGHGSLIADLDAAQAEVVQHDAGPLFVAATAGSGKTRAVVRRIAYLHHVRGVDARRVLAITFTKKARDEMRDRVDRLVPGGRANVTTFHALCRQILSAEMPAFERWELLTEEGWRALVHDACGYRGLKLPDYDVEAILAYVALAKSDAVLPETPEAKALAAGDHDAYLAYGAVERLRAEKHVWTFDDWLVETVLRLRADDAARARWAGKWLRVIQDEAQDQNGAQAQLMELLARGHRNYMVVGDAAQSVYGFRGARPDLFTAFPSAWNARVVRLANNYRSSPAIVEEANRALRMMRDLEPTAADAMVAARADAPADPVAFEEHGSAEDEAAAVVARVREARALGRPWSDHAVLYRVGSASRPVEEALSAARIPYHVHGGIPFYERAESRDLLAYLRIADRRATLRDARRCINRPSRYLGRDFLDRMEQEAARAKAEGLGWVDIIARTAEGVGLDRRRRASAVAWVEILRAARVAIDEAEPPRDVLRAIVERTGFVDWLVRTEGRASADNDRVANVAELQRAAARFPTVGAFLDHVDRAIEESRQAASESGPIDRVTLMTVHRSKGLEFPVVHLVRVADDVLPHFYAQTEGELEEERRVYYVAVTRARDALHVSWHDRPSPFVAEHAGRVEADDRRARLGERAELERQADALIATALTRPPPGVRGTP